MGLLFAFKLLEKPKTVIQKMDRGLQFWIQGAKERKANKIGHMLYHLRGYHAAKFGV